MAGRRIGKIPDGLFTLQQAARITGAVVRTIRDWIKRGIISPAKKPERSGQVTLLNFKNLLEIRLVLRLRQTMNLQKVIKALETIREWGFETPTDTFLIDASGDDILVYFNEKTAASALKRRGQMFFVDLVEVKKEIKESVQRVINEQAA